MLLWERYCDEQALRLDDDIVRMGGEPSIPADTRAEMTQAALRLGEALRGRASTRSVTSRRRERGAL
jgi:hypothetical protein